MKNFNSTTNQEIKGQFVQREIQANVNQMVEFIINTDNENAPFTNEDIENYFTCPEFIGEYANFRGGSQQQVNEEIERLKDLLSDLYDDILEDKSNEDEIEAKRDKIGEEIEAIENLETEPQEIFEWWIVSSWLCEKLAEKGEPVIKDHNIWGRCCSGQAILLDQVISEICSDMEILDGQASSWAKK